MDGVPYLWQSTYTDAAGSEIKAFAMTHHVTQLIHKSTRIPDTVNSHRDILDHFVTSDSEIYIIVVNTPLRNSDHSLVTSNLPIGMKYVNTSLSNGRTHKVELNHLIHPQLFYAN